jgi:hypothetical protein
LLAPPSSRARDVDGERAIPLLERVPEDRSFAHLDHQRRVVDEDVDAAERFVSRRAHRVDGRLVGDVHSDADRTVDPRGDAFAPAPTRLLSYRPWYEPPLTWTT